MKIPILLLSLISVVSLQGMEEGVQSANKQLSIMYGYSTRANNKKFTVTERNKERDMPRQEDEVYADSKNKFFGIYDGHGNSAVADTVSSIIYGNRYVGNRVANYLKTDLYKIFNQQNKPSHKEKFEMAYAEAEKNILSFKGEEDIVQGSTATNIFIDEKNILHVAWVGDSSLKLVKKNGTCIDITQDHRPKVNVKEQGRIQLAGGKINDGRLAGLELTRSFGDKSTKDSDGGKGLTAVPEYTSIPLTEEDDFLIMATDGVWDFVSSQDVVSTAKQAMEKSSEELSENCSDPQLNDGGQEGKSSNESNLNLVARVICQKAQGKKSTDNISALIIKLDWKDVSVDMSNSETADHQSSLEDIPVNKDKKRWNFVPSFITERSMFFGGIAMLALLGGLAYYLKYLR